MSLRPQLAGLFAVLVAGATISLSGCSSSSPRDVNWGTDVALFYVPPDVPPAADTQNAHDSADAIDGGAVVDGGAVDGVSDDASDDASMDGND